MIIEIDHRREEVALLARENDRLSKLVDKLDELAHNLRIQAHAHKNAADDRAEALALKTKIERSYKESLADAHKETAKLQRKLSRSNKLTAVGVVAAFILGLIFAN